MPDDVLKYRRGILLACAGALLHNLGKVSSRFVEYQIPPKSKRDYKYKHICGLFVEDVETQGKVTQLASVGKKWAELYQVLKDSPDNKDTLKDETRKALKNKIGPLPDPFNDRPYRIGDLIEYLGEGEKLYPNAFNNIFSTSSLLTHLMNRSHHGASGGEKEGILALQQRFPLYMATPLGYEKPAPDLEGYERIREEVERVIQEFLADPQHFSLTKFMTKLEPLLRQIPADTRRGLNDVTVWDIGHTGIAFLKAGIWSCAQKQNLTHDDLANGQSTNHPRWRLWRVGLDGLNFLSGAVSVADLRVRQRKLRVYLDDVKRFVEEEYPVATEVYRDENGAIYIFPDWNGNSDRFKEFKEQYDYIFEVANWEKPDGKKEAGQIKEKVGSAPAKPGHGFSLTEVFGLRPATELTADNFYNHPECKKWDSLPANTATSGYIGEKVEEWITKPLAGEPVPEVYCEESGEPDDLCPYCGVRTVGGGENQIPDGEKKSYNKEKAKERKICCVCMFERGRIAQDWWKEKPFSTVWVDEVVDSNGRVALMVGKFGVEKMLEDLVYPGRCGYRYKYKPYWHGSSRPSQPCNLKINNKDFHWNGTYLVGPPDFSRYSQATLKVEKFAGQDVGWKPQLSIDRVELTTSGGATTLYIHLADDALLTVAKLVGKPDDWSSLKGETIEASGKQWKVYSQRVLVLQPKNQNEPQNAYEQFLYKPRDPQTNQSYLLELELVTFESLEAATSDSFARFRRVWETTAHFWREVAPPEGAFLEKEKWQEALLGSLAVKTAGRDAARRRLVFVLEPCKQMEAGPFHAYELTVEGVKIGVVCTDPERKEFTSIENLGYIARQMGASEKEVCNPCAAAVYVSSCLKDRKCRLDEPLGYGQRGKSVAEKAIIREVSLAPDSYCPVIPILAEPRIFAALVPAKTAFDLARKIKEKYEMEMGKVRWRLPITLGIVFFEKHTPLRAVLDAGWRILKAQDISDRLVGKVTNKNRRGYSYFEQVDQNKVTTLPHPQEGSWPASVDITVEVEGVPAPPGPTASTGEQPAAVPTGRAARELRWIVTTTAGDGHTFDIWYPWVRVEGTVTDRALAFQDPRPQRSTTTWLHVMELRKDDKIGFYPSTFDFVFLDHAGRRFELAYDKNGRCLGLERRPYYLEEIDLLAELWDLIGGDKGLSEAQIHALWQVLLNRWRDWRPGEGGSKAEGIWRKFCRNALLNAEWPSGGKPSGEKLQKLIAAAEDGVLFDVFELFLTILKASPHRGKG